MQNKGFIKVFAVLLALVCLYYLSFTFVTRHYYNEADKYAKGIMGTDKIDSNNDREYMSLYNHYLNDSLANQKVWLGYTLKEAREKEINLGLDLRGGMNVIMEISVPDILKNLSGNNMDDNFNKALDLAQKQQFTSQSDFITLFRENYEKLDPGARLSAIFATREMDGRISSSSTNAEVEKVLREEVKSVLENSFNILRLRIDRFGVAQPNIQQLTNSNGRILIELPGVKEPERVRKLLQGSANLEFWETYELSEIYQSLLTANNVIRDLNQAKEEKTEVKTVETTLTNDSIASENIATETTDSVKTAEDTLLAKLSGEGDQSGILEDQLEWQKQYPLFAVLPLNQMNGQISRGPVVGMALAKDTATVNRYLSLPQVKSVFNRDLMLRWTLKPQVYGEGANRAEYYQLVALKITTRDGRPPLEGDVVTRAQESYGQQGSVSVSMSMNAEGTKDWARLTRENIGRSIAIVLDDYVYSFPTVNTEITGGNSEISGNFTPEEAQDLVNVLKSGKMAAPARIIQEDVVGPSLGQEAINNGIIAFIIALVILMVYLFLIYGTVPGLIANGALLLNLFFTIGILVSFQAVLTLAGIAGIVLSLAIAVDANVLIQERIKEELRAGKNVKRAVEEGYKKAFSAIFDANITSILTAVILFYFGTGPIRGFATTLIIGILVSFFTAVFLTRITYEGLLAKGKLHNLTFTTKLSKNFLVNPSFHFMENRKKYFIGFAILFIISLGFLFTRGLNQGIDFTGGRNYVVRFDEPVNTLQVQEMLSEQFDSDNSLNVITIGANNQVRISTNYMIEDNSEGIDEQIEAKLYNGLKPLLKQGTTQEEFSTIYIQSSQKVGPSIADDIKRAAIWAVIFSVIGIGLYILLRFRDISFSIGTITSLIFDAVFILGCYAMLWGFLPFSMEIDQTFIGAILTAIGYSVNDKVVVFDRVREYLQLYPKRDKKRVFDEALNTTLNRTFNTSFSTLLVLFVIFFAAGETIRSFAFAMIIGVLVGTATSLFLSAPLAYQIQSKKEEKTEE
ncbi:MAG: protein translocase subunit SecDF [Candidatus Azobacteroides sp.]|nr:protein translocase subunit SecDF [Candidatus Azobacteroides sp.]